MLVLHIYHTQRMTEKVGVETKSDNVQRQFLITPVFLLSHHYQVFVAECSNNISIPVTRTPSVNC